MKLAQIFVFYHSYISASTDDSEFINQKSQSKWTLICDHIEDNNLKIESLTSSGRYKFRVRAHNSMGWGPWSFPSSWFRTDSTPPTAPGFSLYLLWYHPLFFYYSTYDGWIPTQL